MKGRMKPAICCTVSALTLSMAVSMVSMAKEMPNAGTSNIQDQTQESDWNYRAVADVTDELFIRSMGSENGKIIGYLPSAGGAYVLEKGDDWTKVRSGDVVGYIKTEYLAFGQDAKKLAEVYGTPGVEISWDGVNIFNNADPAAKIVDTVNRGEGYEYTSNDGTWVNIQLDNSKSAYVPAEDVKETLLLETAVPTDDYVAPVSAYSNGNYTSNSTNQTSGNNGSANTGNSDNSQNVNNVPETETTWTETPQTETTWTEAPQTEAAWTEAPQTETAWTEAPQTETTWTEAHQTETTWTEAPETEAPVTETPATEAPATEAPETESNASSSASADDLTLLASIIYCEAGNQPRDGKVAVGAVVMNRVASSSFAGNIRDVIYESGQFMPTWDGSMSSALANGVPSDCYEAAQAALNGENPVGGALYFNTGSGKGIKIGAHQFY
ncbi:cell wall hydrolase [Robinsoniella peoriensis]|uniref:Germination-specific amidase n=1 Tax=Robinsoniella peoriensis TaxID=180332 RepID=A0A4V6HS09_9FIRM|nr:cell wall hydrolase [Robinsoniella peoriensis]MDU7026479.1 cell wall hydrolase [Clostridiales bacterium]TLD01118.1 Germination-specific amidase [Robinsoniella peoriensis]